MGQDAEAVLLTAQLAATAEVYFSPQARPGYFDQELSRLPEERSLFEFFLHSFKLGDQQRTLAVPGHCRGGMKTVAQPWPTSPPALFWSPSCTMNCTR